MAGSDQSARVWVMSESAVYHRSIGCAALNRSNRYHVPRHVPLAEATSRKPYSGRRRPCSLCAALDEEERP